MAKAHSDRSPMTLLEDALIDLEGSVGLLGIVVDSLSAESDDAGTMITVHRYLSADLAVLRKAYDAALKGGR